MENWHREYAELEYCGLMNCSDLFLDSYSCLGACSLLENRNDYSSSSDSDEMKPNIIDPSDSFDDLYNNPDLSRVYDYSLIHIMLFVVA